MKRIVSLALAVALGIGTVAATAGSASADPRGRGGGWCNRGQPCWGGGGGGPGWQGGRPGWQGGGPGWQGGGNWNRPPHGNWNRPPQWAGRPGWGPRPGWRGPPPRYWYGPGYYNGQWYNNSAAALAAGAIIGLGVGAAIANSGGGYEVAPPPSYGAAAWNRHVAYCEDRYRSYNPRTDTFTGYDGRTYRCVGSY